MAALQVVTFIVAAVFFIPYQDKNNPFPLFARNRAVPKVFSFQIVGLPWDTGSLPCFSSLQKKPH